MSRLKGASKRTGVKVTPNMLRHTFGTQLVNAGCRITTIQMLLGHQRLNSTMVYARVYNRTVAEDYYGAMTIIEKRLEPHLPSLPEQTSSPEETARTGSNGSVHLLALVEALNDEALNDSQRQLVTKLRKGILDLG